MIFGAIEGGGTKFVCGIGSAATGSIRTTRIPTRDPSSTMDAVQAFFAEAVEQHGPIGAVGIASFGPLELDPRRADYGSVSSTPKPGWSGFPILHEARRRLGVRTLIDTDVTAAAQAELQRGAGSKTASLAYITVGTGIGVGFASRGALHPGPARGEAGHVWPRRHAAMRHFAGCCPFHKDCFEGLASGPALMAAWGESLVSLGREHAAWSAQADHLGQLCANVMLSLAPDRIVLGGGVMSGTPGLLEDVRERCARWLAGYGRQDSRIVAPECEEASGLVGAYLLAEHGLTQAQRLVAGP